MMEEDVHISPVDQLKSVETKYIEGCISGLKTFRFEAFNVRIYNTKNSFHVSVCFDENFEDLHILPTLQLIPIEIMRLYENKLGHIIIGEGQFFPYSDIYRDLKNRIEDANEAYKYIRNLKAVNRKFNYLKRNVW